jgi:phosphopantothenoylcysteine decarboxylase / phosphopantothenate---cysteine ligase
MSSPVGPLSGKRVVVGVSGGIAAYKAIELCRRFFDAGAHVIPVLTEDTLRFVGALSFSALSSEPARVSLWNDPGADPSPHTSLAKVVDLIVVAPATARLIGRYAAGISDDLLTATLLATRAPVLVAPAMHTEMWEHPAVEANMATLRTRGVHIVGPGVGVLASGDFGAGRMADVADIVRSATEILVPTVRDLDGVRVLISAGGTREAIDPVRFIGNRSSGKQGYAIAHEALRRGASVTIVSTVGLVAPGGAEVIRVESAAEMAAAMNAGAVDADVVVMAAAVADFRPATSANEKIKKSGGAPEVILEPTVDIIAGLGKAKRRGQILVGFAAETNNLAEYARDKLTRKNLDLIVANDVSAPGVGFEHETNAVTIFDAGGGEQVVALQSKAGIANAVLDRVVAVRHSPGG